MVSHMRGAPAMHRFHYCLLFGFAAEQLLFPAQTLAQWSPTGAPVCVHPAGQYLGGSVSDGAGGAFVMFGDDRSASHADIFLQHLTASGTIASGWAATGVPVCTATGDQGGGGVIADGEGGAIVVWEDYRTWYQPGVPFPYSRDIYAQRITAAGEIASGWQIDGVPVSTLLTQRYGSTIASDGAGGAFFAWEDYRNGAVDIYALRLTADGARAEGWPQDGLRLSNEPVDKGGPRILADGSGGAFFVWTEGNIKAQRLTGTGEIAPGWAANGKTISLPSEGGAVRVVGDGAGGAFVAWQDFRTWPGWPDPPETYADVYAQHITGTGDVVAGWPASGLAVTALPSVVQWQVEMAVDGTGGALITWEDYRTGVAAPYVQRLTPAGGLAPGWQPDGVRASDSPAYGLRPHIVSNDMGGALIGFNLYTDDNKAYAQHVTGTGAIAPGWNSAGTPLASSPGGQLGALMVPDGLGGAIVAWQDTRAASGPDIYAQRITLNGPVPVQVSLVSAEAEYGRVTLNWFAGAGAGLLASVERRTADGDWQRVETISADGTGRLVYEDRTVAPGARYAYRLTYDDGSGPVATSEVWVDVPGQASFALQSLRPNPAVGDLVASFSLASDAPATLELFDLSGRRLLTHEVGSLGPGPHRLNLSRDMRVPAGVYSLRLVQGEQRATVRAVVIR